MASTLIVTDNRSGKQYELTIENNAIRATDLARIRVAADEPGLVSYDPALTNTATCRSAISFIDGE
ncbi:MAG TPA: citrate (Si)-synthase, partial [Candidatus Binatia bacterium]|nr:citrate (Si)-synthase [Candidatus Binatia bacterium]